MNCCAKPKRETGTHGAPPTFDADTVRVLDLASKTWTDEEAEGLAGLKGQPETVRKVMATDNAAVRDIICGALGPTWWMNGTPKPGIDCVEDIAAGQPKPPDWRTFLPDDKRVSIDVDVAAEVSKAWEDAATGDAAKLQADYMGAGILRSVVLSCALDGGGANAYATSQYDKAAEMFSQAYVLASSATEQATDGVDACDALVMTSRVLDGLGRVARETGEYVLSFQIHVAAAQRILGADLSTFRSRLRPSPLVCAANALSNAGVAAYRAANKPQSKACHTLALRLRSKSGDHRGTSSSLGNLAKMSEPAEALPLYEQSLEIREKLKDTWGIAGSHRAIAVLKVNASKKDGVSPEEKTRLGDEATKHLATAVPLFVIVHDNLGIAEALETSGLVWHSRQPATSAKLLGAAVAVRQAVKAATDVVTDHAETKALRESHAADYEHGLSMSMDETLVLFKELVEIIERQE